MKYIRVKKILKAQLGTPFVEGSEIMRGYSLSDMAVEYAREAAPHSLDNIIQIKNLSGNPALGTYTTNEATPEVPQDVKDAISNYIGIPFTEDQYYEILEAIKNGDEYFSKMNLDLSNVNLKNQIIRINTDNIQKAVIRKLNSSREYPENVFDILDFHFNVIREIASTIVHEAKHGEQDLEEKRSTDRLNKLNEPEAYAAEEQVKAWFNQNSSVIYDDIADRLFADGTLDRVQYEYYQQSKI